MDKETSTVDTLELIALVGEFASRVGFGEVQRIGIGSDVTSGELEQQEAYRYFSWASPYAKILLLITEAETEDKLREEINSAQNILDDLLLSDENIKSMVIDGYLLVAMKSPPQPGMLRIVREIELDTHLCRKLIFWPDAGITPVERWDRLLRSTILGLPESSAFSGQIEWPDFDESQEEIWRSISKSGSPAAAARKYLRESV